MGRMVCLFIMIFLISCSNKEGYRCEKRNVCPEGALFEAKTALRKKDMMAFFETITDKEVRAKLKNSIGLCSSLKLDQVKKYGYKESTDCELILNNYGWIEPEYQHPSEITGLWESAIMRISEPRKMLYELEINHRKHSNASSFVWRYLEPVKIIETVEDGNTAYSVVDWGGEKTKLLYYNTEAGWQFEQAPWEAY
ncbi:hypothetical protein [Simiduia aestuariiviva]|uniref:Lipoprotein n=1 Tax=Simiduia aestuariiviva TaxID=1510459 RepID=A0A839UM69_9GAMM|nr:hypothetical protein [Simiduia aestuariiviva]MBB3166836.1 hypothetical protein [Simiduia aestuariiviva]